MYRLTPRMQQNLRQSLAKYHELFDGGRCLGWELEELIFKAIQSDSTAGHHATWQEAGHDDEADIRVRVNGEIYPLQIKSGTVLSKSGHLRLSGYRFGRFEGDLEKITEYLKRDKSQILSVPYRKVDDDVGRHHIYQIIYIDSIYLHQIDPSQWEKHGSAWRQTNQYGVMFSLHPTMSWQVWWKIPLSLVDHSAEFSIG